jgi:ribosome-associated protein
MAHAASEHHMDLELKDGLRIRSEEIEVETSRASGPGGQHVNKTETRVTLRWSLAESSLPDWAKNRVRSKLRSRLTKAEQLLVSVDSTRNQSRNLTLAYERLRALVAEALVEPKTRRATRPSRRSQERRLEAKRRRGDKKRARKPPSVDG